MGKFNKFPQDLEGLSGPLGDGYTVKNDCEADRVANEISKILGLDLMYGTGNPTKTPHIQHLRPSKSYIELKVFPQGNMECGVNNPQKRIVIVTES